MRTAGMIMGIVGGAIALLFGIIFIFSGTMFLSINSWESTNSYSEQAASATGATMFMVFGISGLVAGVMGLVGGLIIRKKNVASGVMMIVAAVLSLVSFFNIISMVLFILGGVFALMRDRQQQFYVPPYPMQPNYGYPQQPYAPQPYTPPVYPQPEQPQQPVPPVDNPPENPQP